MIKEILPDRITQAEDYKIVLHNTNSYEELLAARGLQYIKTMPYLQAGEITQVQGWILHISVIKSQLPELLNILIPYLAEKNIPFKIPANSSMADSLMHGASGYPLLGKIICIYYQEEPSLVAFTKELIQLTTSFQGVYIPTDIYLGGAVYTRYGSFAPVVLTGPNGESENYIYDKKGKLIPDIEAIPFSLPRGIQWPFGALAGPKPPKAGKLLNGGYVQYSVLKPDMKGNVIKAINLKVFPRLDWCLIKEGRKYMCMDDDGKDIRDRLQWQKELHKDLYSVVPIPKLLDYFSLHDNEYLVMEFIEGRGLDQFVQSVYEQGGWKHLALAQRIELIDFSLQILSAIQKLHDKGYVHRDITLPNFLINKAGKLFLIDVELAYSIDKARPYPPFRLGTQGHMSPEQLKAIRPTVKEDIYALGATLLVLFTGIHPYKMRPGANDKLEEHIYFFTGDGDISSLIARCLHSDASTRPGMQEILLSVERFKSAVKLNAGTPSDEKIAIVVNHIKPIIQEAINTMAAKPLLSSKFLWHSKAIQHNVLVGNELLQKAIYIGLREGIAGPMLMLALAARFRYDIDRVKTIYAGNWDYINNNVLNDIDAYQAGLFTGTAGLAVAIAAGIRTGLIENTSTYRDMLPACLNRIALGLDLAIGLAGNGLALLHCADLLEKELVTEKLNQIILVICKEQRKDGAWLPKLEPGVLWISPIMGFAHGNAGICYFLLQAYKKSPSEDLLECIQKSLRWFQERPIKLIHAASGSESARKPPIDLWVSDGIAGVALVFIEAYKVLSEISYKTTAEQILHHFTPYRMDVVNSQGYGMAGLGEIYLEAYTVFKDTEWLNRAVWVANVLTHVYWHEESYSYWLVDHSTIPTADLLMGNSGIVHFLMRCCDPEHIDYIFYPFPG